LIGLWCAVSAAKIIGLFVTRGHIFTKVNYTHSDTVFEHLSDCERIGVDLQPDSVTAHTGDRSTL